MTAHVFIVDSVTFDLHLRHLFAGTGAKENRVDFLRDMDEKIRGLSRKVDKTHRCLCWREIYYAENQGFTRLVNSR